LEITSTQPPTAISEAHRHRHRHRIQQPAIHSSDDVGHRNHHRVLLLAEPASSVVLTE
ncbi:hypothetical protein S245_020708, partial [Arachis hypogaea]